MLWFISQINLGDFSEFSRIGVVVTMAQEVYSQRSLFGGAIFSTFPNRFQVGIFVFCFQICSPIVTVFMFIYSRGVKIVGCEQHSSSSWSPGWLMVLLYTCVSVCWWFSIPVVKCWVGFEGGICGPCPGRKLDHWAVGLQAWRRGQWKRYLVSSRPCHWTRGWWKCGNWFSTSALCLLIRFPIVNK